jgi:ribosome-binding factor A
MDPHRAERVSEALREELAEIIEYELSDPRLSAVTVTEVHVTPDLRHAQVGIASGKSAEEALAALEHARNYLRRELSARLRLFRVPELHFEAASAGGPASRVEELLKRVRKSRRRVPPDENEQNSPK